MALALPARSAEHCTAAAQANACQINRTAADPVDAILSDMKEQTSQLTSYEADVEYIFLQPLLESQTVKKGKLYYMKSDDTSKLRISFDTLIQDDEEPQQYKEIYIFDGEWLTQVDYQIEQITKRQLAEPNEPVDAFELAKRNFPIMGFNNPEEMKQQFDIELLGEDPNAPHDFIRMRMNVKDDSQYADQYTRIEFWIDQRLLLPARIIAESTEEDIYKISLLNARANEHIEASVFDFQVPAGFGEPEIIPLK
jgi:outer membrane lipoprotein-sorting protein